MKEYDEALRELIEACRVEYERGRTLYKDTWKEASMTAHLGTVVNDALKLEGIDVSNTPELKHRITDIVNYLVFVWAKISRAPAGDPVIPK